MRTAKFALAAILLPSLLAAANPDLGGWVDLWYGPQLSGFDQKGHDNGGPGFQIGFKGKSAHALGFDLGGALADWASVRTGMRWDQYVNTYTEQAGPNGSLGLYERDFVHDGQTPYLGLVLYPAACFGRRFQPGRDNANGPAWWPVLNASFYQGDASAQYNLNTHTGGYSGSTVAGPTKERWQGYRTGLSLPLLSRFSLWAALDHQTWSQTVDKTSNASFSWANSFETFSGGLSVTVLRGAAHPELQVPFLGGPGALRLEASAYKQNSLWNGEAGMSGYQVSAQYAFHSAVAAGLSWGQDSFAKPLVNYSGFINDSFSPANSWMSVDLKINVGSPSWRGRPDAELKKEALPAAPPPTAAWPEPPTAEIPAEPPADAP